MSFTIGLLEKRLMTETWYEEAARCFLAMFATWWLCECAGQPLPPPPAPLPVQAVANATGVSISGNVFLTSGTSGSIVIATGNGTTSYQQAYQQALSANYRLKPARPWELSPLQERYFASHPDARKLMIQAMNQAAFGVWDDPYRTVSGDDIYGGFCHIEQASYDDDLFVAL
jgi:hypothetical protein